MITLQKLNQNVNLKRNIKLSKISTYSMHVHVLCTN